MNTLPATDLRKNAATWAVNTCQIAAVAHFMHDALPNEKYDPHFMGQAVRTTYYDTRKLELRKNREKHHKYITLRTRCYQSPEDTEPTYALSAKTEEEKFRLEITVEDIISVNYGHQDVWENKLPAHLLARLIDVSHAEPLEPVVNVRCQRYAIEDETDRFTLDTHIRSDLGKVMSYAVLEYKSKEAHDWPALTSIGLYSTKVSKFLWATTL